MGKTVYKSGRHIYAVDAYVSLAKCYRVEAESKEEAEKKVQEMVFDILNHPSPEAEEGLLSNGFQNCDEIDELRVSGEETVDGEIEYY